uniref:Ac1177 n=1 Tax=Rattus norvegicus TaxID=10116 RepID=Q7TQ83_RAT|nr:Ac1177 [Rattus norvegicus]|eukprot:NP_001119553.1 liver-expressed antimicrobial peptide 2 precursor [Rattus norvegicus]
MLQLKLFAVLLTCLLLLGQELVHVHLRAFSIFKDDDSAELINDSKERRMQTFLKINFLNVSN